MTLFGWDASHFDGRLSLAILQRARAEGISFFTHKIAEGLNDTEGSLDDTALAAARDAGMPFIGGYLIPRTNATPAAQVAKWLELADSGEGWWRTFPGWFWQVDVERWSYDNVPASVGIECAQRLRAATGRQVILYASHGQYWDDLAGWDGPLWNADYVSVPAAGFGAMYPGDGWLPNHKGWVGGWLPYSGKPPAILQYTSSATIAGLTTCDANAFRGSVADFAAMIGGNGMALDDADKAWILDNIKGGTGGLTMDQLQQWLGDGIDGRSGESVAPRPSLALVLQRLETLAAPELSDAQMDALAGKVADKLGSKLDAVLAKLSAAGAGLAG